MLCCWWCLALACKFCRRPTGGSLNALLPVVPRSATPRCGRNSWAAAPLKVARHAARSATALPPGNLGWWPGAAFRANMHSGDEGERGVAGRENTRDRERVRRRSAVGYSCCLTASLGGGRLRGSRPAWCWSAPPIFSAPPGGHGVPAPPREGVSCSLRTGAGGGRSSVDGEKTERETERETERDRERQTGRDRQSDSLTVRQSDRQTVRQTV